MTPAREDDWRPLPTVGTRVVVSSDGPGTVTVIDYHRSTISILFDSEIHWGGYSLDRFLATRLSRDAEREVLLMQLLKQQKWCEFDEQLVNAELPIELRQKLLELKDHGVVDQRREDLVAELRELLKQRKWQDFDAKLLNEKALLKPEWDSLLKEKADKLLSCLPSEIRPDSEQARILASLATNLRVTARAGSGKTRLLTALTYFLIA